MFTESNMATSLFTIFGYYGQGPYLSTVAMVTDFRTQSIEVKGENGGEQDSFEFPQYAAPKRHLRGQSWK